jgi:putative ABC transport system permease protein
MKINRIFFESLKSLTANKLRSSLTILGIVIGVAAVIAMVSLGRGVQASVSDQFSNTGTTQLTVFYSPDSEIRDYKPLTIDDMEALRDPSAAPDISAVAAQVNFSSSITSGTRTVNESVYGVTANYGDLNKLKLLEGRFLTQEEVSGQVASAVIGPRLARSVFQRQRGVIGEVLRINGQPFRVVGLLDYRGSGFSMFGTDNTVLLPVTVVQSRMLENDYRGRVDAITVQVTSAARVKQATDQINKIIRQRHQTPVGLTDINVFASKELIDALDQITGVLTTFLGAIAAISLLVGGIGIMNIMLVSVTERTREIGLRKALGARRRDILMQFLFEASLLSLVGGLIGILLGWLIGVGVSFAAASTGTKFSPVIGADVIALATIFSSAIGIFFGLYPASRAASLPPVIALRAE